MTILHLASLSDWLDALVSGEYRVSTKGATLEDVGFIHASHPSQLAGVAAFLYADVEEPFCVLVMDEERIAAGGVRVVEENGGDGELYPHIYGPIRPEFVVDVIPAHFDDRGSFTMSGPLG